MANKECEKIMDRYLKLDKNERVPSDITLHLFFCRKCRTQIKMLSLAEKEAVKPFKIKVPFTDKSIEAVMMQIAPKAYKKIKKYYISMANWVISGTVMILLVFMSVIFTNTLNNRALMIAYGLLLAACVTIYCSIFISCNIDFFVKKMAVVKQHQ